MTGVESRILFNQLTIMETLKEHLTLQHGKEHAAGSLLRLDGAIQETFKFFNIDSQGQSQIWP